MPRACLVPNACNDVCGVCRDDDDGQHDACDDDDYACDAYRDDHGAYYDDHGACGDRGGGACGDHGGGGGDRGGHPHPINALYANFVIGMVSVFSRVGFI